MRYLLDTCALIWFLSNDQEHMPSTVMDVVENETNEVHVSVASIWEISIKSNIGKLELPLGITDIDLVERGFDILEINFAHATGVRELPLAHRDPFDRLMISQCKIEGLTAITPDPPWQDKQYGIQVHW
jgi:PIN domain nuclease of toxin-antitoxin system